MSNESKNYLKILLVVALIFLIRGIMGWMDAKNYVEAGYSLDSNWAVIEITEGSAAEAAGMQLGDIMKKTGGIDVTDTKALVERSRPKAGDVREFVMERDGEEVTLEVTYAELNQKYQNLNMAAFFIGLLFMLFGLYAYSREQSALRFYFALLSVGMGYLFMNGPYFESSQMRLLIGSINGTISLFTVTVLALFMLKYPPESKFLQGKGNIKKLFLPFIVVALVMWAIRTILPDSSTELRNGMRYMFGAYFIFFFGLSLLVLIRKYFSASTDEKKSLGLTYMLIGTVVGLLPTLISSVVNTLSQSTILPGSDYYFLSIIAIPVFFTMALNQLSSPSAATA